MAMAVTMARHFGAGSLAAPSAGNAAVALAAYGSAAGLPVTVALPDDTPSWFVEKARAHGASVHLVEGTIGDAGAWLRSNRPLDAFDVSTLREPYRVEGKKIMAYELWEQLGRSLPDVIVYPTGGGTGLIGMWRAFGEMERLGWVGPERPRMVSAQVAGCDPVVRAFNGLAAAASQRRGLAHRTPGSDTARSRPLYRRLEVAATGPPSRSRKPRCGRPPPTWRPQPGSTPDPRAGQPGLLSARLRQQGWIGER